MLIAAGVKPGKLGDFVNAPGNEHLRELRDHRLPQMAERRLQNEANGKQVLGLTKDQIAALPPLPASVGGCTGCTGGGAPRNFRVRSRFV